MKKPIRYRMLVDSTVEPSAKTGDFVYSCRYHDYGLANDDSRLTGKPHISVTLNEDGDCPSFTVQRSHVKEVPYDDVG